MLTLDSYLRFDLYAEYNYNRYVIYLLLCIESRNELGRYRLKTYIILKSIESSYGGDYIVIYFKIRRRFLFFVRLNIITKLKILTNVFIVQDQVNMVEYWPYLQPNDINEFTRKHDFDLPYNCQQLDAKTIFLVDMYNFVCNDQFYCCAPAKRAMANSPNANSL